jgi:hypothetical protein
MAGALLQLVAYGAQDLYLTGQPQITFWKVVYRRYTNFACEDIEMTFSGSASLGQRITIVVPRSGDLLRSVWLEADLSAAVILPSAFLGFALIDTVELEIGGQLIDRHYGDWMAIWAQLTHTNDQLLKLDRMISGRLLNSAGNARLYIPLQFWFCTNPGLALPLIALQYHEVKLNITFEPNVMLAGGDSRSATGDIIFDGYYPSTSRILGRVTNQPTAAAAGTYAYNATPGANEYSTTPAITNGFGAIVVAVTDGNGYISSITNQTTDNLTAETTITNNSITLTFNDDGAGDLVATIEIQHPLTISNVRVWGQYVFLDTDERRRFAQMSHEYLIEQLQTTSRGVSANEIPTSVQLFFNHPCKYVVVAAQNSTANSTATNGTATHSFDFWRSRTSTEDNIASLTLQFNGSDRFKARDGNYFRTVQLFDTFAGGHLQTAALNNTANPPLYPCGGFYVYSFALKPGEHQPSGTCNFSRIDSAVLVTSYNNQFTDGVLKIFAVNYNILRIVSGMAGVAYSN